MFFDINLYPGTHRCPLTSRLNFQPAAYLPHPLAHAGNAHTWKDLPDFLCLAAHSPAFISDFQYDLILDPFQPHRCAAAARVALNVRWALLHHAKQYHLRVSPEASKARRDLHIHLHSSAFTVAFYVMGDRKSTRLNS